MWVFKIGGSLARARELSPWLKGLAGQGGGRAVIVPGGGPFADTVRDMHRLRRFPDRVAHDMALLAMEQYGLMMSGIEPALVPVRQYEEIAAVLRSSRVPVWLPVEMLRSVKAIPKAWELSSDSLAAWLTGALGAHDLVLVKSVSPLSDSCTATALASRGIVDPLFPKVHEELHGHSWWVGRGHYRHIRGLLNGGAAGCRIVKAEPLATESHAGDRIEVAGSSRA